MLVYTGQSPGTMYFYRICRNFRVLITKCLQKSVVRMARSTSANLRQRTPKFLHKIKEHCSRRRPCTGTESKSCEATMFATHAERVVKIVHSETWNVLETMF